VPIRLVVVDDHPIVLEGLARYFERQEDVRVVQCCQNGTEALAAVRAHRPAILVLDLRMPGLSGVEVLRTIAKEKLSCRVVVLTAVLDDDATIEALRLGAMGVVGKDSSAKDLLECVRRVYRGERSVESGVFGNAFARALRRDSAKAEAVSTLTEREVEVVRGVADGLRNQDIAARLSITEGTVKIHLHRIFEKIDVDNRVGLVLYAQKQGIL
jgi:DNA-binding NarL/FixJ family response regulator